MMKYFIKTYFYPVQMSEVKTSQVFDILKAGFEPDKPNENLC